MEGWYEAQGDEPLRLSHWAVALQSRGARATEQIALETSSTRHLRPWLFLFAARGFAPRSCYEALRIWTERTDEAAPKFREYWRGICEFLPMLDEETLANNPGSCAVSIAEGKRFCLGLQLEAQGRNDEAVDVYSSLCEVHPLAAARLSVIKGAHYRLHDWRRYKGKVNTAVTALQLLAIARANLDCTSLSLSLCSPSGATRALLC